jgi:hypothetical protein
MTVEQRYRHARASNERAADPVPAAIEGQVTIMLRVGTRYLARLAVAGRVA